MGRRDHVACRGNPHIEQVHPHGSKLAIIFNGSPLSNGDAGIGPSKIRRWILENDWLDAIVSGVPTSCSTTPASSPTSGSSTIANFGAAGKVQLINASGEEFGTQLRRNLGKKRYEISEDQSAAILGIYEACEETKISKISIPPISVTPRLRRTPAALALRPTRNNAGRSASMPPCSDSRTTGVDSSATRSMAGNQAPWKDDTRFFAALAKALDVESSRRAEKTSARARRADENAE